MSSDTEAQYPASAPPKGRVDWVVDRLRDSILLGELQPGERVRTVQLAQAWHVSPTPIREAIQRLGSEGLLDVQAQQGARVSAVSPARALEIFELRALLEPLLVQLSVEQFTDDLRQNITARFDEYVRAWHGQTEISPEMSRYYLRFSDALFAGGHLPALRSLVQNLKLQCLRYNGWFTVAERIEVHGRVMEAVLDRDAAAAASAIADSIRPGLAWAREMVPSGVQVTSILTPQSVEALKVITAMYPLAPAFGA
ncbi:GntR family transcriptional regulator [Subtercola sp. YIM 133946]|uniref:GntR family transcriptional regulator n=1 Tax=Subtercola sp. YIM 133946 TaxID=3118909 RepID=UPI002F92696E